MVNDGDFLLDELPPDWRDSYEHFETSAKTTTKPDIHPVKEESEKAEHSKVCSLSFFINL